MISHFCPSNDNFWLVNSNHLWRWDVWQGLKLGNPMQCLVFFLCACDYSVGFTNGLLYFVSMVYFCSGFETLLLTWGRLLCLLKQKRIKVSRKIFFPSLMVLIGYSGGTSMMVSVKSFHLSSNLTIEGSLLLAPSGALIAIPTYYWPTSTSTPLFQTTPVLNTGLSLSEPLQLYKGYNAI